MWNVHLKTLFIKNVSFKNVTSKFNTLDSCLRYFSLTLEIKDFIVTVILYTKTAIKLNVILGQATDIFIDIITSAFDATEVNSNGYV